MSRAVYVPPAKRKKQQRENQRFHGAFTGGFSAGYFNTVGSKEGWKPSEDVDRQQQVSDFMDDQDHQDFGGPSQLRQEYNGADAAKDETKGVKSSSSNNNSIASPTGIELNRLFEVSHQQGVGLRLLRSMGWRSEASSAFVVVDPDMNANSGTTELSKRKIRKIQLQQSRMEKIPPPKFDVAGLGFEALKDAPEFRRHREYRQKMAQSRAHGTANVYRTSSVLNTPSNKNRGNLGNEDDDDIDANYMAHDTMEDFVGSKSVGGFALREDDDDAYDEDGGQGDRQGPWGGGAQQKQLLNISNEKYNTEIYEPESSDDEFQVGKSTLNNTSNSSKNAMAKKAAATADVFGGALSAWADIDSKTTDGKQESSGRGVLTGFRLGGIVNMAKVRYPGPDVPSDYDIKAHVFAETVHPHVFQAIGRAVQLQHQERQKEASHHEALNTAKARARSVKEDRSSIDKITKATPRSNDTKRQQAPMAGEKFAALAMTMKNRFTSGNSTAVNNNNAAPAPIGLHFPSSSLSKTNNGDNNSAAAASAVQPEAPQNLQVIRTVQTFVPSMLVCKRFHVPPPLVSRQQQIVSTPALKKTKEELFFEQEILPAGGDVQKTESKQEPEQPSGIIRPSMEILKSIFQEEEEEPSSSDESDDDGKSKQLVVRDPSKASTNDNIDKSAELKNDANPEEGRIVPFDKDKERKMKRKRKDRHQRKHKKRSRKHANSDSEDDEEDKSKKRKKKRKHKSKKKKSKKKKKEQDDDGSSSSSDSN